MLQNFKKYEVLSFWHTNTVIHQQLEKKVFKKDFARTTQFEHWILLFIKHMLTVVGGGYQDNMTPAQVTYQLPYRLAFLVKVVFCFLLLWKTWASFAPLLEIFKILKMDLDKAGQIGGIWYVVLRINLNWSV